MSRTPPRDAIRAARERYYVYVVELRPRGPSDGRPEVYVGSSALPPALRFAKHVAGETKASRHVRRRGVRLLPALYDHLNHRPIVDAHTAWAAYTIGITKARIEGATFG